MILRHFSVGLSKHLMQMPQNKARNLKSTRTAFFEHPFACGFHALKESTSVIAMESLVFSPEK